MQRPQIGLELSRWSRSRSHSYFVRRASPWDEWMLMVRSGRLDTVNGGASRCKVYARSVGLLCRVQSLYTCSIFVTRILSVGCILPKSIPSQILNHHHLCGALFLETHLASRHRNKFWSCSPQQNTGFARNIGNRSSLPIFIRSGVSLRVTRVIQLYVASMEASLQQTSM